MNGYLLDTNIISILANPKNPKHVVVRKKFSQLPKDSPIMLPVIAIAEIEFGMNKAGIGRAKKQRELLRIFFSDFPLHLAIDDDTIEPYALVRAKIWLEYGTPTKKRRGHKEKVPDDLFDRVTGKKLGIDERDILIASVAIQYNLVLATADNNEGMKRIVKAANLLRNEGQTISLHTVDWTQN